MRTGGFYPLSACTGKDCGTWFVYLCCVYVHTYITWCLFVSTEAFMREESDDETLVGENASCTAEQGGGGGGGGGGRVNGWGCGAEVAGVPEIVEEILGQVPITHLYSSCRLVCRKWNDIIMREKVQCRALRQ